jgi:cytochrome b561
VTPAPSRYSPTLQALHWLTVALVFTGYLMAPDGSEQQIYSAAGDFDRRTHETLGISVFALTLARLAWRRFDPAPKHEGMPAWMRRAACATHTALYILLFAVPLTAIAGAWLSGHPLTLWGMPDIAPMVSESRELGKAIVGWHTTLGDTLIYLAALHAAAALYHHFALHDGVLMSMVPRNNGDRG